MLGKEGKNLLGAVNSQAVAWMEFLTRLVLWVFDCIAVNVFTLIRSNFGERFMTVINWFFGGLMFSTFMAFSLFADGPKSLLLRTIWAPIVFICFIVHRWVIRSKNKAGTEWYSYSNGVPHLLRIPAVARYLPVEIVEKWLEPAALLIVAWLLRFIDRGFGIMLGIVAIILCLRAYIAYYLERQEYLNQRDARIISKYANAVLEGRDAFETGGFTIAKSNRELIQHELRVAEADAAAETAKAIPASVSAMLDPTPGSAEEKKEDSMSKEPPSDKDLQEARTRLAQATRAEIEKVKSESAKDLGSGLSPLPTPKNKPDDDWKHDKGRSR